LAIGAGEVFLVEAVRVLSLPAVAGESFRSAGCETNIRMQATRLPLQRTGIIDPGYNIIRVHLWL
jgi:hypothetical protein